MKNLFSGLFALLGGMLAAAAVAVSLVSLNAGPRLLMAPQAAVETADAMMAAVCEGDYRAAGQLMYGNPDLGADRKASDAVGVLIWDAFVESLDYALVGSCYATDSGVAQDVTVTCLDLNSVTATLGERSQALLEQRVAAAEDVSEIYDENNDYREDFVMDVLYDAAVEALAEDAALLTREVTLNLTYQQGRWLVVPDQAVLSAISGGIAG